MRIGFVTSSRSDYALIQPILQRLHDQPYINRVLYVTGAHLSKNYGKSIREVGMADERIDCLLMSNNTVSVATAMGIAILKFAEIFARQKMDILFLAGDRFEIVAAAVAAYTMRIPIAHYCGGEKTGTLDDGWRRIITQMATYHFVQHQLYAEELKKQGVKNNIYTVGSTLLEQAKEIKTDVREKFHIPEQYIVGTLHPDTTKSKKYNIEMAYEYCEGIKNSGYTAILTMANQDAYGSEINRIITEAARETKEMRVVRNMSRADYLALIKYANAVVGNSSSGMIEAPYYGTPTINVGERQIGRIEAETIVNVEPKHDAIAEKIKTAKKQKPQRIYDDCASEEIIRILRTLCSK